MRRFNVHLVTEVDFVEGDEVSDQAARNYEKDLAQSYSDRGHGSVAPHHQGRPGRERGGPRNQRMSFNNPRPRGCEIAPTPSRTFALHPVCQAVTPSVIERIAAIRIAYEGHRRTARRWRVSRRWGRTNRTRVPTPFGACAGGRMGDAKPYCTSRRQIGYGNGEAPALDDWPSRCLPGSYNRPSILKACSCSGNFVGDPCTCYCPACKREAEVRNNLASVRRPLVKRRPPLA